MRDNIHPFNKSCMARALLLRFDQEYQNQLPRETKLDWLSDCEEKIYRDVLMNHEDCPEWHRGPIGMDTVLFVPDTFADLYITYMKAQMDLANMETSRYNVNAAAHNSQLIEFTNWYNREHLPLGKATHIRVV